MIFAREFMYYTINIVDKTNDVMKNLASVTKYNYLKHCSVTNLTCISDNLNFMEHPQRTMIKCMVRQEIHAIMHSIIKN